MHGSEILLQMEWSFLYVFGKKYHRMEQIGWVDTWWTQVLFLVWDQEAVSVKDISLVI